MGTDTVEGLSQWGAYGAADAGLDWTEILGLLLPGHEPRRRSRTPRSGCRSASTPGSDVWVDPAAGLTLVSGAQSALLPTGTAYQGWRLVRSGVTLGLQRLQDGTWYTHPSPVTLASGAGFTTGSDSTRLVLPTAKRMALRGTVTAVVEGTSTLRTIAVMPMESYLRGVVPAEMPAGWNIQALRAQSVAARTYAARLRSEAGSKLWDTCDTTACQVFKGTATYSSTGALLAQNEHPRTDQGIVDSANTVLMYDAGGVQKLVFTQFSAANGGWTAAGPAQHPYQVAKAGPLRRPHPEQRPRVDHLADRGQGRVDVPGRSAPSRTSPSPRARATATSGAASPASPSPARRGPRR